MQSWFSPALGAAILIGIHYLFLRAASGKLGDTLGALVVEGTAAVGILTAFLLGARGDVVTTSRAGVLYAAASGLAISGASILIFMALRRGGPVATTGTVCLGGGVTLSALCAPWLFSESFTPRRAIGVALGVLAMIVLSRDPG